MKYSSNTKNRSITKARNVVVVHGDKKNPPNLTRLAKALMAWRLEEARAARQAPKKAKLDQ